MEARCACGAVGRMTRSVRSDGTSVMRWRGGRLGTFQVVFEEARTGVSMCPACQHRKSVFMLSSDADEPAPG